jgi:hypothetical protein
MARYLVAFLLTVLVLLPLFTNGVSLIVDWLWFDSEGYREIYWTILKAQIVLSGLAGMGFLLFVGINVLIARGVARRSGYRVTPEFIEFAPLDRLGSSLRWGLFAVVLLVSYILSQWATFHWNEYLLAQRPITMGEADPIFGLDLGFYLFELPFLRFLYHLGLVTLIGALLVVAIYYLMEGGVWLTPRGPRVAPAARAHAMVLGAVLFLLIAYRLRLGMYNLLFSERGIVYGAGYADVHATLPALWVLLGLAVLTSAALLYGAARHTLRPAVGGVALMLVAAVLGANVYPELLQRFIVTPNEIEREHDYIGHSIEFTRRAYALDRFEEREFEAVEDLTLEDVRANEATFRSVRLWDHRPLLTTFAQLQEIRTYYDFTHVDNDRYVIDGVYRQVSLSPRELNSESLPSRTWINEHLTYTHGYGLCLGPVNEYTHEGLPELFIKDIPPVSTVDLEVTRPEIYFGELGNPYCFVRTKAQEFDYPFGDQNVYTTYEGEGGIPVNGFLRKLLFTLRFGELKILLSDDIQAESRLMIYRRVLDRARRLTPFLHFDRDPYLVIARDGSLVWMLDGYTTSWNYPYSEPTPRLGNYIRNSVKATVSAYDGRVRFYIADPSDPLIQVYASIFPRVFRPLGEMPEDLRAHIRYPEEFFSAQAQKFTLFHMTDPRVFYNREDLWRVAQTSVRGAATTMSPYYTIMKLAGVGEKEEFILMVPFTPARRDNMIAWMAARCDEPNYGRVLVFMFPKQRLVYGPQQIDARIDQDPYISQQLTLWGTGGSTVIRGNLFVIPVENSVIYVQPLYLAAAAGGGLPQLTRVLVSYGDNVVMEPTLDEGLARIFGGEVTSAPRRVARVRPGAAPAAPPAPGAPPAPAVAPDVAALVRQASQHYDRAQQLLRQGDFAGYGEEMRRLGEVLKKLAAEQSSRQ